MQIKTKARYHFNTVRLAIIERQKIRKDDEKKGESLYTLNSNVL